MSPQTQSAMTKIPISATRAYLAEAACLAKNAHRCGDNQLCRDSIRRTISSAADGCFVPPTAGCSDLDQLACHCMSEFASEVNCGILGPDLPWFCEEFMRELLAFDRPAIPKPPLVDVRPGPRL